MPALRRVAGRLLLGLARSRLGRPLCWLMIQTSSILPRSRLRETEHLIAVYHPQPSYALHILLLPKRPFASLADLPPDAGGFLCDLVGTVQSLVREFGLEQTGYRLIANGGRYQEVPYLHFHLVANERPRSSKKKTPV